MHHFVMFLTGCLLGLLVLYPARGYSQPLNNAVNDQLLFFDGLECNLLLDGNPSNTTFLTGQLLGICTRGVPAGGAGPSNSAGGGAATPVTLPKIVQQRLQKSDEGKESEAKDKTANADAVVNLERGISLFFSGELENLDRDVTTFEDGYDSDIWRLVVGADEQITERITAGIALDYYRQDGNFTGGGKFENDSFGVLAFGSFLPFPSTFLQITAGYARKQYERSRIATFTQFQSDGTTVDFFRQGREKGDYDADEAHVSALAGYDHPIGNVTISPRVGLDWTHIDFDTYSETGDSGLELTFHNDKQTSLQSSVGLQTSVALSTGFGVVIPTASVDWNHEFENDQRRVEVSFVEDTRAKRFKYETEKPDRDWCEINAGVVMVLPHEFKIFGNYRTLVGHSFIDNYAGTIGVRYSF